jgi:hypothetical protein
VLKERPASLWSRPAVPALAPMVVALCAGVAGLSLLVPSVPSTDPWGWIVWGREVAHLDLHTAVGGSPAWKPLPVGFTTFLSLAGGAAPVLWLFVARTGGLLSLVFAFRVATRLAGPVAGVVAALALACMGRWLREMAHGYTEPLAAALFLGALDRHLDGREEQAFLLLSAAALARPELWPLALLYGAGWLWRRRSRALFVAGSLAVPALWLVPDRLGSGDWLHGIRAARATTGAGPAASADALTAAVTLVGPPVLVLSALATLLAVRERDRTTLALAAVAVLWGGGLFLAMLAGWPASERYFFLPAVLLCLLAGCGAARAVAVPRGPPARLTAALVLAVLALPWLVDRGAKSVEVIRASVARAELQADLRTAVERAGGAGRVLRLGRPALPRGMAWTEGALAWKLNVHIGRMGALRTSVGPFVKALASEHPFDTPARPHTAAVAISRFSGSGRLVVFAPFGDTPLVQRAGRHQRLTVIAASGRWRVAILPPPHAKTRPD